MIDKIIAYESGQLSNPAIVALFQQLLDSGVIYTLQGHYQRTAQRMLDEGLIASPQSPKKVRRRAVKRATKETSRASHREIVLANTVLQD